ncbi:hypothetical protein [Flavobacterium sp.]|uniref:hypothetical protein n=1 Tax=Flavobacterium sp. TaxID=239 RepID=UPI0033423DC4
MKNLLIVIAITSIFISCKLNDATDEEVKAPVKDSTIFGADKDDDGCLASAGYTWSKLNKECVKAFTGIQLNPASDAATEDETLCAYVLFNEEGDQAEIFLPDDKSFIVTKGTSDKLWVFKDYQLIAQNGYQLKKAGQVVFSGDGEIGSKVSGSDNPDAQ